MSDKLLSLSLNHKLLPCDSEMFDAFTKDGVKKETAIAFSNLFAFLKGTGELDTEVRAKMEEIELLTPENEIIMENIEDSLEWILMTACYEGKIRRKKDKDGVFKYQNTKQGNKEAIKIIRKLSKK